MSSFVFRLPVKLKSNTRTTDPLTNVQARVTTNNTLNRIYWIVLASSAAASLNQTAQACTKHNGIICTYLAERKKTTSCCISHSLSLFLPLPTRLLSPLSPHIPLPFLYPSLFSPDLWSRSLTLKLSGVWPPSKK